MAYLPAEERDGKEYKWWEDKQVLKRGRITWNFSEKDSRINARWSGHIPRRLLTSHNARQLTAFHKSKGGRNDYGRLWNNGFTDQEVQELKSQGISPYEEDASVRLLASP